MSFNTAGSSVAVGFQALWRNTTGGGNTALGTQALWFNTTGAGNTAIGIGSLVLNTMGLQNTATGTPALQKNTTGERNVAIGSLAGQNQTTGSDNIYITNQGVAGESGTIRIGIDGAGNNTQQKAFIAGVRSVSTGQFNAIDVVIDSNGQLGTVSSSRRYKEDIHDMAEASGGLLQLRPVTFRYKQASADGSKPRQYGLIAEEVAEVYPDLVVYNADGEVEAVQYRKLITMVLNELQKEHQVNLTQAEQIHTQQAKMLVQAQELAKVRAQLTVVHAQSQQLQNLTARLAKLEAQSSAVPVSLH